MQPDSVPAFYFFQYIPFLFSRSCSFLPIEKSHLLRHTLVDFMYLNSGILSVSIVYFFRWYFLSLHHYSVQISWLRCSSITGMDSIATSQRIR